MKKVIHKADTRGHSQYDWLDSYHTFSFDEYFDSDRINFGALRVLNDDKVAPGQGFQTSATWRQQEEQPHYYCRRNSDNECGNRNLP